MTQAQGQGLRIRLRLDQGVPELADLPWEYLFPADLNRFLALSDETPLVRYLEVAEGVQPLRVTPPLTLLAIIANPSDAPPLAVEEEWRRLQTALAELQARRVIRLERLSPATWPALQARLRQGDVHILHFVGHGLFDPKAGAGGLIFEDAAGRADEVSAETLAMLLHDHAALRLIFLNACEGARSGRRDSFAGIAQHLVRGGLPAVLAMQFPVSDDAAIALAQVFYQSLADGYPADAALSEARKAIAAHGNPLEWATPVLFSRSDDNRLIELPQGDRRPVIETKSFEPETILIPAGPFLMGSADPAAPAAEQPQHSVELPDFRIGKYPVTVRQYAAFIKDKKDQPAPQGWFNREPPADRLDHPVTNVSWLDALAYCAWLSELKQTGRHYRLPSEAEWEKAARGRDGGRYPWEGKEWCEGCVHSSEAGNAPTDTAPVGLPIPGNPGGMTPARPNGASPYGCQDMLGNVQEWTRSLWGTQPGQPQQSYQDQPGGGPSIDDPADLPAQARLVHRGGSFKSVPADLRCTARGNATPESRIAWRGFRVVMHIEEPA